MSVEPSYPGGTKAQWNDKETEALLDHLIEKKTLGQGNGNFKDQVFTSAAEAISSLLSSGPVKTSKNCKTKWTTLKGIYTAIEDFRSNVSGAHWDAVTGATIEGPTAEKVWNDIVKARSAMKPFKDQGWSYYDKCATIMYASKARGGRAFFVGLGAPVSSSSSNVAEASMESTSISIDHGSPTYTTDPLISSFGEIHNMSNTISSLYAAQSHVKPAFPPFGQASVVMGDDGEAGELISVSSSSYGIKRSHDSLSSQPPPSIQSTSPSSDPSNLSETHPLPPTSPPKKRSRGSKSSDAIAPPSRTQKGKLTTAVAVNGMQGTINRMTDMLATVLDPNALATAFASASASASAPAASASASTSTPNTSMGPPAAAGSSTAPSDKRVVLQHVKHDNGLTSDEKARLLNIFTKNPGAVETYLEVLDDDILRLGYAHELLKDN